MAEVPCSCSSAVDLQSNSQSCKPNIMHPSGHLAYCTICNQLQQDYTSVITPYT